MSVAITEYGHIVFDSIDEYGRKRIDGVTEFGHRILELAITATIIANEFPMSYLSKPTKAKELRSKVEGATITRVTNIFPHLLQESGKAKGLISKWS